MDLPPPAPPRPRGRGMPRGGRKHRTRGDRASEQSKFTRELVSTLKDKRTEEVMSSAEPPSVRTLVLTEERSPTPGTPAQSHRRQVGAEGLLKGEARALGVVQVLVGAVQLGVGVPLTLSVPSTSAHLRSFFLLGAAFIASGILSILVERHPRIKMLQASVTVNVLSVLLAGAGVVIHTADIVRFPACEGDELLCNSNSIELMSYYTFITLLVFTLLELTVSIVTSAFICKLLRNSTPYGTMPEMLLDSPGPDD